jgi:spermidine synthase
VLFVPVTAMGGMMPLLFRSVDRNSASLGRAVGLLYCLNTAGCVTGALVGGYAALVRLDLDEVVRVCLVLSGVMFLLCSPGREEEELVVRIRRFLTFGGMVMLAVLVLPWSRERLAFGTFRPARPLSTSFSGPELFYRTFSSKLRVVAYKDDPNTSVAIVESTLDPAEKKQFGSEVSRSLYVNGKSDGASVGSDLRTTRLVGHIPALLSAFESPNVAVVGFGLGGTVGTLTRYPEVSRVDVIEIAPAVRSFAPYFDEWNHGAAGHPKVRWNMGDAYRVLGASTERYSIIVSEPSNPWVAGVERLYAREFFEVVKRKLTAGGLYGQWFHTYSISEQTFGLILNTFRSAFPHVRVFAFGTDLLLLGGTEEISRTHLARLTERMQRPEVKEELEVFELATPEAIMGLEQWIDPEGFEAFGLHSLEFPQLAFAAGKDFFLQESVSLGGILENAAWGGRTRERARRSLIALHAGLPLGPDAAIRYGTVACGMSRLEFFDAWDRSSRACRTTLASLLLHGELSPGPHVEVDDPAMIGYLAGAGEAPPVEEDAVCDRAFRYLSLFGSLDSPLFELDTDRLRRAIAPCLSREGLDAEVVRTRLDAVLEATGRANAN